LNLGLASGGHQFMLVLNGKDGRTSGLEILEGRNFALNESTYKGDPIPLNRPIRIKVEIRKTQIRVTVNDTKIIDWEGPPEKLALYPSWIAPKSTSLFLASYDTTFRVNEAILTPVSGTSSLIY